MTTHALTTFDAAKPYGGATLAVGAIGALVAINATSTAAIVMSVALAIIGAYAFIGVLACYWKHSDDPAKFQKEVGKFMLTTASAGIADLIATVAKAVVLRLIFGDR
ncbi:MAG: hypothetical protein K1000chlam2_00860 [Chlamydiae bacterium]|nr:hypothetical protein [Chlamydiota bacterium]